MTVQLYHGDCLEIMPTLAAGSVDAVICDLPYGTTACKWDTVIPFAPLWEAYRRLVKPNGAVVLTAGQPFTSALIMSNTRGFRYSLVWVKNKATGFLDAPRRPLNNVEDVVVFCDGQPTYNPVMTPGTHKTGGRKRQKPGQVYGKFHDASFVRDSYHPTRTVYFQCEQTPMHPTQKPVSLMAYLIETYTNPGDTVLDNCFGSGTTGVACVRMGRNFIGIERDERYFCLARKRIADAQAQGQLFAAPNPTEPPPSSSPADLFDDDDGAEA